jgi:hypothetical protein
MGGPRGSQQTGGRQRAEGRGEETIANQDDTPRSDRLDEAKQGFRGVHGSEKTGREEDGRQEIQGRTSREKITVSVTRSRRVYAMQKRNRKKQTTTLEERLRKFAEDARAAASRAPPGFERERLIRQADKAKALGTAAERLLYSDAFANPATGTNGKRVY